MNQVDDLFYNILSFWPFLRKNVSNKGFDIVLCNI